MASNVPERITRLQQMIHHTDYVPAPNKKLKSSHADQSLVSGYLWMQKNAGKWKKVWCEYRDCQLTYRTEESTPKASGWLTVCYCETDINPRAPPPPLPQPAATGSGGASGSAAAVSLPGAVATGSGAAAEVKTKIVSPKNQSGGVFSFARSGASAFSATGGGATNSAAPASPSHITPALSKLDEQYWSYLESTEAPYSFKLASPGTDMRAYQHHTTPHRSTVSAMF